MCYMFLRNKGKQRALGPSLNHPQSPAPEWPRWGESPMPMPGPSGGVFLFMDYPDYPNWLALRHVLKMFKYWNPVLSHSIGNSTCILVRDCWRFDITRTKKWEHMHWSRIVNPPRDSNKLLQNSDYPSAPSAPQWYGTLAGLATTWAVR